MRGKRGLSQVITTVILILLILAAIGGLWAAVSSFIQSGSEKIDLQKYTLGLTLKKAVVDYDTGIASVRVKRDSGEGDLTSIKFIVEDDKSSEVFEEFFNSFPELAERTFALNLTKSEFLTLNKVHKISIAPVFSLPSGNLQTGEIAGSVEGLNEGIDQSGGDEPAEEARCTKDDECPKDSFEEGTEGCNIQNTMITKTKFDNFCQIDRCRSAIIYDFVVEDCSAQGKVCYNGLCIDDEIKCTAETVDTACGVDGPVGDKKCHSTLNATALDYKDFSCNSQGTCEVSITEQLVEMCEEGDICNNGECFTPLECIVHTDCCPSDDPYCGRVCNEGVCEDELAKNTGNVKSAWPQDLGNILTVRIWIHLLS